MFDPLELASRFLAFLDRHRSGTALTVAILVALGFHSAGSEWSPPPFRRAMDLSVGTLQAGASGALAFLNVWVWKDLTDTRSALLKERMDRVRLEEALAENARLRAQLGYEAPGNFRPIPCMVTSLDTGPLGGSITVDRGSGAGVVGGEAVMSVDGLVGHVAEVFPGRSRVRLLTHYESPVSVRIVRNRVIGILEWDPASGRHLMRNVAAPEDVAQGDSLVSSGLGGVYPEGLYVGQVVSLGADPMGLVQEIVIRPGARFHSLEELFILRPTP